MLYIVITVFSHKKQCFFCFPINDVWGNKNPPIIKKVFITKFLGRQRKLHTDSVLFQYFTKIFNIGFYLITIEKEQRRKRIKRWYNFEYNVFVIRTFILIFSKAVISIIIKM